jgi:hypothetical protein
MELSLAQQIVELAVQQHYEGTLPKNLGKPKTDSEWTVFAALIAVKTRTMHNDDEYKEDDQGDTSGRRHMWVVSSATGTKCTAQTRSDGSVLHDSHAEVLVRRGLVRILWSEIIAAQEKERSKSNQDHRATQSTMESCPSDDVSLLETTESTSFRLRPDIQLYLYISDSPCGDAAIYGVSTSEQQHQSQQFTGAKIIVSQSDHNVATENGAADGALLPLDHPSTTCMLAREPKAQLLGRLRSKSGRSNLAAHQRSSSMSCSDKLVRWSLLGLQGGFLTRFIPDPIVLTGIVVGRDWRVKRKKDSEGAGLCYQEMALRRAVPDRVAAVLQNLNEQARQQYRDDNASKDHITRWIQKLRPPLVDIVEHPVFARGKAAVQAPPNNHVASRKRKRSQFAEKVSPSGLSINWQSYSAAFTAEVTVGARGILHGKKPRIPADYVALQSRLSRASLLKLAAKAGLGVSLVGADTESYQECKSKYASCDYKAVRTTIFEFGPLSGWIVGSNPAAAANEIAAPS